jgi:SAM-dependent methyltransferase
MSRILFKLYNSSPREIVHNIRTKLHFRVSRYHADGMALEISKELQKRFMVYQTSNLRSISTEQFFQYVHSKIGTADAQAEGYCEGELERQRDSSVRFDWGHNHDFGEFKLKGRMGDRHINELANFIAIFRMDLEDFRNKVVFDVGCWTGGTTLLLAALGNRVFAIEEVKKYADMASFLSRSFGVEDRVSVNHLSIYNCNSKEFFDRFDIIYFPGVIYHLSDPLLALRILFNALKPGGKILIESEGIDREEPFCRFDGSLAHRSVTTEKTSLCGWNWFVPSPSALYRMMREAGFDEVETLWHHRRERVYGYGKKISQTGICKAGLSVPGIR